MGKSAGALAFSQKELDIVSTLHYVCVKRTLIMIMAYCYEQPRPRVTTKVVIFTILDDELKLLLSKHSASQDLWVLPGGYVGIEEDLEANAVRELAEETGVRGVYLEQLYTFGRPNSDPEKWGITVAYYALVSSDRLQIKAATGTHAVDWFALGELPPLSAEHQ